jgi:hypothetical protein
VCGRPGGARHADQLTHGHREATAAVACAAAVRVVESVKLTVHQTVARGTSRLLTTTDSTIGPISTRREI